MRQSGGSTAFDKLAARFFVVGMTLLSSSADAWNSPEHEALGGTVYSLAAARFGGAEKQQLDPLDPTQLASWSALFEKGVAEPDYCHSYWHSNYIKGVIPCAPGGCKIKSGVPVSIAPTETFYGLSVNESHFGELTKVHWQYFDSLALAAAGRYRDTCNPVCRDLAVTLEAFAQHYLTDRTASGHAFSDDPDNWKAGLSKMDGMRGCFHGQPGYKDFFIGLGTAFECKNWAWGKDRGSLGESARRFGGAYFALGAEWWSDDNLAKGGKTQKTLSFSPGVDALERVFARMLCKKEGTINWVDTFVSNRDMCQVMLGQCCISNSAATGIQCTYCQPHITETELKTACPILGTPKYSPESGGVWTKLRNNTWVQLGWPGQGIGGWSGTFVAEQLARGPASVNPDARYNTVGTVLMAAGCLSSGLSCGAPLRNQFCDGWPCDKPKINFCRGALPARPCAADPCGEYYLHTEFVPKPGGVGGCVCKNEAGDGVCAVDVGENFTNSGEDCGADRLYCGDGYCNKGAGEQEYTCPKDCAKPPAVTPTCTALGPQKHPATPVCGNGKGDVGESCQLCPKDIGFGPAYAGFADCSKADPTYAAKGFSDHGCFNPFLCVTQENGGWCDGFCDDVEGCVPGTPVDCSNITCESDLQLRMKCGWLTEKQLCDDCNSTTLCDGTADFDCTVDECDKAGSPMGECKHTNICCDDCDACNGKEIFDYDAMGCEAGVPDIVSPCIAGMCGEHPNGCGVMVDCGMCPDCGFADTVPCPADVPVDLTAEDIGISDVSPDWVMTDALCIGADTCCAPVVCTPGMCDVYTNGCGMVVDCGSCPIMCGDMICDPSESCVCPLDCGTCEICGDGICNGGESCTLCPTDCGMCPTMDAGPTSYCGDGICNGGESCTQCPTDCGMCPTMDAGPTSYCGDGSCNGGESCTQCPTDCGMCPTSCSSMCSVMCPAGSGYNSCCMLLCGP
ncbi:MAG: hypothetical protein HUU55_22540 [Myxococcales bacterium]|nr:hypothetical protein [Myxococcales bacterium]